MEAVVRAVLDSNILARAAKPSTGPAREVLTRVRTPPHCLVASPFLLNELERVLNYPRLRALHGLSPEEIRAFVEELYQLAEVVQPPAGTSAEPISRDPDDNPILQAAVLGRANVLCTLDRHFRDPAVLQYCAEHGIQVMSDIELLQRLRDIEAKASPPSAG
jgi:putative PIN family toxin of toxin-antitoxin system